MQQVGQYPHDSGAESCLSKIDAKEQRNFQIKIYVNAFAAMSQWKCAPSQWIFAKAAQAAA